mmetsp:Transcript_3614/g.7771  ORF Transcript_3614/g.7771 Transcript_3614/m.7771 type:complete len:200 (-) Transcript_3614:1302-1901(-)
MNPPSYNLNSRYSRRMSELHSSLEPPKKVLWAPHRWSKNGWRYLQHDSQQDYLKHENKRNKFATRRQASLAEYSPEQTFRTTNKDMFSGPNSPLSSSFIKNESKLETMFPPLPLASQQIERRELRYKSKVPEVDQEMIHFKSKARQQTLEGILNERRSESPAKHMWAGIPLKKTPTSFNRRKDLTTIWQEKVLSKGLSP